MNLDRHRHLCNNIENVQIFLSVREKERGEAEWGRLFQSDERTLYRLRNEPLVWICLKGCLKWEIQNARFCTETLKQHIDKCFCVGEMSWLFISVLLWNGFYWNIQYV